MPVEQFEFVDPYQDGDFEFLFDPYGYDFYSEDIEEIAKESEYDDGVDDPAYTVTGCDPAEYDFDNAPF